MDTQKELNVNYILYDLINNHNYEIVQYHNSFWGFYEKYFNKIEKLESVISDVEINLFKQLYKINNNIDEISVCLFELNEDDENYTMFNSKKFLLGSLTDKFPETFNNIEIPPYKYNHTYFIKRNI